MSSSSIEATPPRASSGWAGCRLGERGNAAGAKRNGRGNALGNVRPGPPMAAPIPEDGGGGFGTRQLVHPGDVVEEVQHLEAGKQELFGG